jgi:hypothetical protein
MTFAEKFKETSGKKIGKIPILYIAGAGLLIGAVLWMRHKSAPSTVANAGTSTDTTTAPPANAENAAFSAMGGYTSQGLVGAGSTIDVTPSPPISNTNAQWSQRAITWLIGQNLASPGAAQAAILAYLGSADLSYEQGQLVDAVLKGPIGLPPEPLVTVGAFGQKPAQRQFTHFPGVHTVKGPEDNGYGTLATLYYGGNSAAVPLLREANIALGVAGPFPVGTKVTIPAWVEPQYYVTTQTSTALSTVAAKNGLSQAQVTALNIGMNFPVGRNTHVRVK